jgi:hypothetical protein
MRPFHWLHLSDALSNRSPSLRTSDHYRLFNDFTDSKIIGPSDGSESVMDSRNFTGLSHSRHVAHKTRDLPNSFSGACFLFCWWPVLNGRNWSIDQNPRSSAPSPVCRSLSSIALLKFSQSPGPICRAFSLPRFPAGQDVKSVSGRVKVLFCLVQCFR